MAKAPAAFNKVKCTVTGKGCFVAGTIVATIYGGKAIETIEVGDKVLATDPETGEMAYKEVLKTYTYVKDTLVYIEANGEIIETTKEHPFWVEGQGWTKAKFLNDGDLLRDTDGNSILIDNVEIVPLPENQYTIVYNLEVADYHTYYVSDYLVLVHNDCGPCGGIKLPKIAKPEKIKNALSNFKSQKWNIGGNAYSLDKKSMTHILTRHHPEFWDGSKKAAQSFFNKKISISDVKDIANNLMLSNSDDVAKIGLGMGQISGTVNGVDYVLGLKNGRIGQLYPKS